VVQAEQNLIEQNRRKPSLLGKIGSFTGMVRRTFTSIRRESVSGDHQQEETTMVEAINHGANLVLHPISLSLPTIPQSPNPNTRAGSAANRHSNINTNAVEEKDHATERMDGGNSLRGPSSITSYPVAQGVSNNFVVRQ
jgi:hypothetical protein